MMRVEGRKAPMVGATDLKQEIVMKLIFRFELTIRGTVHVRMPDLKVFNVVAAAIRPTPALPSLSLRG